MTPTSTGTAAMSPLESEILITPKSTGVRLSESDDMSITSLSGWRHELYVVSYTILEKEWRDLPSNSFRITRGHYDMYT